MSVEYRPPEEALGGLQFMPLGEGVVPLEAVVLIKALDADGNSGWYSRYTEGLSHIEVVGALGVMKRLAEDNAMAIYDAHDEGEDE